MKEVSLKENNADLISVIIPVYNTERYLEKCLQSVCGQEYSNLEIILVNDGSTDGSLRICHDFQKKDFRITVINQENQGPAMARNNGIVAANGKYIAFVDSDDFVSPCFLKKMYELAVSAGAQLVQCVIKNVTNYEKIPAQYDIWSETMSGLEFLRSYYNKKYSGFANPVNKLYAKELLTDLKFPDGRIHEDAALTYKIYYKADKVVYTNEELYFYYMSPDSIMRKPFYLKRLDWLDALEEKMVFLTEIEEDSLYRRALQEYQAVLLKLYYNVKKYYNGEQEILGMLKRKLTGNYHPVMKAEEVEVTAKILFFAGHFAPYAIGKIVDRLI